MRDTIDRLLEGGASPVSGDPLPRAILDELPVGVAINRAADGTWIYHNAEAERILARPPSAVSSYEDYASVEAYDAEGRRFAADRFPAVRAARAGERLIGEYMKIVRPDGALIELKVSSTPVRDQTGTVVYGLTVFEDVTALRDIQRKRAETEARLAEVLEATNDGVFAVSRDWTITYMNARARDMIALGRDLVGENLWAAFPGAEGTAFFKAYRQAMDTGEPRRVEDRYEPLNAIYEAQAQPTPEGLSVFFKDVTEERAATEARETLTRELDHRVRNLFLLTSGMIRMGARGHDDVKAFAKELDGRIRALAEAHDLIKPAVSGSATGAGASVGALLEKVVKPHLRAGVSVEIAGEGAAIGANAAADLALVLHELATNAAKYGALAVEGGRLEITVSCDTDTCRIDWREACPDGVASSGKGGGFGAGLVQSIASGRLGGALRAERGEAGMWFHMTFPVARLAA